MSPYRRGANQFQKANKIGPKKRPQPRPSVAFLVGRSCASRRHHRERLSLRHCGGRPVIKAKEDDIAESFRRRIERKNRAGGRDHHLPPLSRRPTSQHAAHRWSARGLFISIMRPAVVPGGKKQTYFDYSVRGEVRPVSLPVRYLIFRRKQTCV